MRRALVVGIDVYPRTGSNLLGCVADAHAWTEAVSRLGYVARVLTDRQATREVVMAHIAELFGDETATRRVFIFAGHGTVVPSGRSSVENALCTTDVMRGGVVLESDLRALTRRSRAGRRVLIVDACHAGGLGMRGLGRTRFLDPTVFLPGRPTRSRRSATRAPRPSLPGTVVLAACREDEEAHETKLDGIDRGVFSSAAIPALTGRDPSPTYDQWIGRIGRALIVQHPQLICTTRRAGWAALT